MPNSLTILAIRARHLLSHVCEYWLWRNIFVWRYRPFVECKCGRSLKISSSKRKIWYSWPVIVFQWQSLRVIKNKLRWNTILFCTYKWNVSCVCLLLCTMFLMHAFRSWYYAMFLDLCNLFNNCTCVFRALHYKLSHLKNNLGLTHDCTGTLTLLWILGRALEHHK